MASVRTSSRLFCTLLVDVNLTAPFAFVALLTSFCCFFASIVASVDTFDLSADVVGASVGHVILGASVVAGHSGTLSRAS